MFRSASSSLLSLSSRARNVRPAVATIATSLSPKPLLMGCVSYDPAVGDIWSGIRSYLVNKCGVPFDYVLFTNYEAQVRALTTTTTKGDGMIDIAWNGPIAHVMAEDVVQKSEGTGKSLVSLGMRDVDRDFTSIVLVRKDTSIQGSSDLQGKNLLTGTKDSPQAHIVPLYALQQLHGLRFRKVTAFDFDVGKHGDTAVGEVEAMKALFSSARQGQTDEDAPHAAVVSKMMWDRACENKLPGLEGIQEHCRVLDTVSLPVFDHCIFDAIMTDNNQALLNDFGEALLQMDMERSEEERCIMALEGIRKSWLPARQEGYNIVRSAMLASASHIPATNFAYKTKRSFSTSLSQSNNPLRRSFGTTTAAAASTAAPKSIAVIGAGVAGLQAIRALKGHGLNVTAFDASPTVGGLWRSNYQGFGVQVPKQLYEFQDYPMTSVPRGGYATGPQVQAYVEQYADDFGLRESIQFNTAVTSVKQNKQSGWTVETKNDGGIQSQEFDYLVVATGLYANRKKYIPSKPGQDVFPGTIMHSSDFYNIDAIIQNKNVVVVGSGKSAVDSAVAAARSNAKSVTLLQRTAHWPTPQKIAGLIPFQYIFLSRLGTALVSVHRGTFPGGSGPVVNAFRNSVVGPLLMRPVFGIVEALFAFQLGLTGDLRPKVDVVDDFYKVALVLNSDLKNLRKAGKINVQMGEIQQYNGGGTLSLTDGSTREADVVVYATGFDQSYSMFTEAETLRNLNVQDDGLYLYRYVLPEHVPNLAFIGHTAAISNISSYGLQAEWLARKLTGKLVGDAQEPSAESIHQEIEARKKWARSWMPPSSCRGMNVLLHQTHYHDQLLRDMGLDPLRKSNILSTYFMPYEPADYNGIMAGSSTSHST